MAAKPVEDYEDPPEEFLVSETELSDSNIAY